ncbi:MAG: hypothetical protein ACI87W_003497, partial [Halieaceae bacterium]
PGEIFSTAKSQRHPVHSHTTDRPAEPVPGAATAEQAVTAE